jgi:hypothetical protein
MYFSFAFPAENFYFKAFAHTTMVNDSSAIAKSWRCVVHNQVRSTFFQNESVIGQASQTATVHKLDRIV